MYHCLSSIRRLALKMMGHDPSDKVPESSKVYELILDGLRISVNKTISAVSQSSLLSSFRAVFQSPQDYAYIYNLFKSRVKTVKSTYEYVYPLVMKTIDTSLSQTLTYKVDSNNDEDLLLSYIKTVNKCRPYSAMYHSAMNDLRMILK